MGDRFVLNTYNDTIVRQFVVMTVIWAIVGMAVGVLLAAQLVWPQLNFDIAWLTYGRLRPLHTNAVVFAFGGSALFATAYYVVQRTCHARLFSRELAAFTFWGWQLVIVLAAVTLPLGITQSKEYAELEWPIDILLAMVWVAFAVVFFGTIARRRIRHIYVANWYYGAFIITVAVLHIVNSLAMPVSLTKSYSAYSGVVDAMVQWWYGHNAVGFFLTAAFLGMMYYFVPKQAQRPIWSYRLGVINFWALMAVYMWAGPHHLMFSSLPDWVQTLGMVFSIILWAPSWGAAINGIMTVSPEWGKLRNDIALRFMMMSLVFYAIATFEGSLFAIKSLNAMVALHRVDHRACARRRAGLGCHDYHRRAVCAGPAVVEHGIHVQRHAHACAFLVGAGRHGVVRRVHVGGGRSAGHSLGRVQRGRYACPYLYGCGQGDHALLHDPTVGWPDVPVGHVADGLERVPDHRHVAGQARYPDTSAGLRGKSCCFLSGSRQISAS